MLTLSNSFKEQVIAKQVAARLTEVSLSSISSNYQTIHFFRTLDDTSQVVLAIHLVNKLLGRINLRLDKNSDIGIKTYIGINDQERYDLYKGTIEHIEEYLLPILATFENDPQFYEINSPYQAAREKFSDSIKTIESNYSKGRGKYTKRFGELIPEVLDYLNNVKYITEGLKAAFQD